MSEIDGLVVHHEEFERRVQMFALLSGRSFEEELRNQARLLVRDVIKITPPFSRKMSVTDAKRAGENAINRDLRRLFRGVELKGQRSIPLLFGKPHPDAPWQVPTVEKHPNVGQVYRNHRGSTKQQRAKNYRNPFYVDKRKLSAETLRRAKRVGYLGAGFLPAAQGLGVAVPAFMKRHTAPGGFEQKMGKDVLRIAFTNAVTYATRVGDGDLPRRIRAALGYRVNAMQRQLPYLMRRHQRVLN